MLSLWQVDVVTADDHEPQMNMYEDDRRVHCYLKRIVVKLTLCMAD